MVDGAQYNLVMAGRAAAARIMTDACVIDRLTGRAFNETTGVYTDTYTQLYSGPCRVKFPNVADNTSDIGIRPGVTREYIVSVPISAPHVAVNDRVTITASSFDSQQTSLVLHVLGVIHGSQVTARRMRCQEVTA